MKNKLFFFMVLALLLTMSQLVIAKLEWEDFTYSDFKDKAKDAHQAIENNKIFGTFLMVSTGETDESKLQRLVRHYLYEKFLNPDKNIDQNPYAKNLHMKYDELPKTINGFISGELMDNLANDANRNAYFNAINKYVMLGAYDIAPSQILFDLLSELSKNPPDKKQQEALATDTQSLLKHIAEDNTPKKEITIKELVSILTMLNKTPLIQKLIEINPTIVSLTNEIKKISEEIDEKIKDVDNKTGAAIEKLKTTIDDGADKVNTTKKLLESIKTTSKDKPEQTTDMIHQLKENKKNLLNLNETQQNYFEKLYALNESLITGRLNPIQAEISKLTDNIEATDKTNMLGQKDKIGTLNNKFSVLQEKLLEIGRQKPKVNELAKNIDDTVKEIDVALAEAAMLSLGQALRSLG